MKAPCGQEDCDCGHTIDVLMRRFGPFLKRLIGATKPYHENEDTPSGAAELLFYIHEDAVMLRAVLTEKLS